MLLENHPYPQDGRVRDEAGALRRAGYTIVVVAPKAPGQGRREEIAGVTVKRYRLTHAGGSRLSYMVEYAVANAQLHLRGLLAIASGADIIHLHNPPDTLFLLAAVARAFGRKVIFDQHDLAPELFRAKFGQSHLVRLLLAAERASFRFATTVVAANQSHRDVALRRGHASSERVVVVRNGPRRKTLVSQPTVRAGSLLDPQLVFVGMLDYQDGVMALPAIIQLLRRDQGLIGSHLTVIGDGPYRQNLEDACVRLGVADAVSFLGRVDRERIPELLSVADIAVDPAPATELNHRSTMVKIAEYLAAGKPIVAYALTETRRTAGSGALYAPGGHSRAFAALVARLARNHDLRVRTAFSGRRRADKLVWEHSEDALLAAYERLGELRKPLTANLLAHLRTPWSHAHGSTPPPTRPVLQRVPVAHRKTED